MENYSNLIEAINGLRQEGYTEDFNLKKNCLECNEGEYGIFHDEFVVDKYFRFEDDTDPSNQSIIYAISSKKDKRKGVLVNGYGIYSDSVSNETLDKLKMSTNS